MKRYRVTVHALRTFLTTIEVEDEEEEYSPEEVREIAGYSAGEDDSWTYDPHSFELGNPDWYKVEVQTDTGWKELDE
jgi:hypothetical protein